jgi:hypothetical protein
MQWLEKYFITKAEDVNDLERYAATNQYINGMSKEHAEISAYQKYKRIQHAMAAAYHLDNMEAAKNLVKDPHMADKHLCMYILHARNLQQKPLNGVLPEVQAFRDPNTEPNHVFKPHPSDILVLRKDVSL